MIDRRQFLRSAALAAAASFIPLWPAIAKAASSVSYGPNSLDIYPASAPNAPVMIFVHGGAWRLGSRDAVGNLPDYCRALGYVLVSVGYTLSASVGRQADEVGAAVHWVKSNIAAHGGNPQRVAMMGHSAGCHLACLATLSGRGPSVSALVANDTAAYDVAYLAEINNGRLPLLYSRPFSDRSRWRDWSPISFAPGASEVPVLVAWSGGKDRDIVSKRFAAALAQAGHRVTPFDGRAYSHLSIRNAVGKKGDPLTAAITAFLAQNV